MSSPSTLTAAELMRQLGFKFPAAAGEAALAMELLPTPARRLHVTNGDSAAEGLRQSGVAGERGEVAVTADLLHEGPAPGGLPPERWRKVRARYLAESGYDDYDSCLARLTRWDRTLEEARSFDEVVLWFEHDLFDQLLLIRALDAFASRGLGATELSLICIGEFPGIVPFHGLGQLTPPELATLLPRRQRVDEGQKLLARDAWRAFRSPTPAGIEAILARDASPLPFLAGALRRHLEELPAVADGLARSERQILRALAAGPAGGTTFPELFGATQAMEERVYMGDLPFHRILRELASSPRPLVRLDPGTQGASRSPRFLQIALTASGREVLDGRDDWVRSRGIDRWLGGIHLQGVEAAWRWDAETGRAFHT
ncbi:MAG TPA: DUF1835 domain-containing protein [Thermoanaerobaculia bacterium]|nr:DUF1835 domain-containing protein [Thermoanaerobaculia bacterium]